MLNDVARILAENTALADIGKPQSPSDILRAQQALDVKFPQALWAIFSCGGGYPSGRMSIMALELTSTTSLFGQWSLDGGQAYLRNMLPYATATAMSMFAWILGMVLLLSGMWRQK